MYIIIIITGIKSIDIIICIIIIKLKRSFYTAVEKLVRNLICEKKNYFLMTL